MLALVTRALTLFLAYSLAVSGQSIARQKAFLHQVDSLRESDPARRLQEDLGINVESAIAILATVRNYNAEADRVDASLKRSILTRRLQLAGEFKVTYSAELDLVNWANLDLNLFLLEQMEELASRIGETEYEKVAQFIESRMLPQIAANWKNSPLGFWRDSIKAPLSSPGAEDLFIRSFKDLAVPPADIVSFMEGTLVSVTPEDNQGRKILLSMQGEQADVALLIDGKSWRLLSEPTPGSIVRFSGVPVEFTPDPFLILFAPQRISGLSISSSEPNLPFTSPALAR